MRSRWLIAIVVALLASCIADFPPEYLDPDAAVNRDAAMGDGGSVGGLALNGASCANDDACFSGHCVGGKCCNQACGGACERCDASGTCLPVAVGEDPPAGKTCNAQAVTTCGRDGKCDGVGGCRLHAGTVSPFATVACTPAASCTAIDGMRDLQGFCDGTGTCFIPDSHSCGPFACVGGACQAPCTNGGDCVVGLCNVGQGRCDGEDGPWGAPCTTNNDCESPRQCVGGSSGKFCCESACTGPCMTCTLPGSEGRCVPVPAGLPPNPNESKTCTDETGDNPCAQDGLCDGTGACRMVPAGTACGTARCVEETANTRYEIRSHQCDGNGTCAVVETSCGAYRCLSTTPPSCRGRCTATTNQCITGTTCQSGECR